MTTIDTLAHEYGWTDHEILDLSVAKVRGYLDAAMARRKAEFRRSIALTEWSTRLLGQATLAAAGAKSEAQKEIGKASFPWEEDKAEEDKKSEPLAEGDDLSFIETGDTKAAEKNAGKNLPALALQ